MSDSTTENWLEATIVAACEFGETILGSQKAEVVRKGDDLTRERFGSYIALAGDESAVQVGVITSDENCEKIARCMFGMEDGEELAQSDMDDALGEVVNIIAGGVKNAMIKSDPSMKLGLPMVIQGDVRVSENCDSMFALIEFDDQEMGVIVLRYRRGATSRKKTESS